MYREIELQYKIKVNSIHSFFKTNFKSDYVFKGERHDFWEIVFVISGNVGITADSDVYVLERGQAVIHRPNEFHKIWSEFDTNPTVVILSFSASEFPDFSGRIISLTSTQMKMIDELIEASYTDFDRDSYCMIKPKNGCEIKAQEFWLKLELMLLSTVSEHGTSVSSSLRSAELYSAAVKIMEDNPDAGYCIDEISALCSISTAYLKKIFLKYSGCGVMHYYNRLRARIACGYLDNGKSVKETAILLGFNDQNYFSTFFKRVIGKSPTEYRNRDHWVKIR